MDDLVSHDFLNQPLDSSALAESMDPISVKSVRPEISPGPDAAKQLGVYRVEDWSELDRFMKDKAGSARRLLDRIPSMPRLLARLADHRTGVIQIQFEQLHFPSGFGQPAPTANRTKTATTPIHAQAAIIRRS
jgi:hypothetical protein